LGKNVPVFAPGDGFECQRFRGVRAFVSSEKNKGVAPDGAWI